MTSSIINDSVSSLITGFIGVIWGALGVMYAKHLEVGSQNRPRPSPHPLCGLIRFASALAFLGGLYLIGAGAWLLMTHPAAQR